MKVYRYLSENELNKFLNGDMQNLGHYKLLITRGEGFYLSRGYDIDAYREFAVPADWIKPDYLVEYTLDTDRKNISLSTAIEMNR
ncbi:MAG: hypothetical protein ACI4PF_05855 [Christensenellales bacterium]